MNFAQGWQNNKKMIRQAKSADYKEVAPLIIQAMEDLAMKFTRSNNIQKAIPVFEAFFQQKLNQYSYENTLVFEENGEIIGSIIAYDGAKLNALRQPFLDYLWTNFQFAETPEDETEAGEYYLDTLSVLPGQQGKGIGRQLIEAMIGHAQSKGFRQVGLLVDVENPLAKKLYERLGFQIKSTKPLMGGQYEHLVFEIR